MKLLSVLFVAVLCLSLAAHATTVQGTATDSLGAILGSGSVTFNLLGCTSAPLKISDGLPVPTPVPLPLNSSGVLSGTVVGNDDITCGGTSIWQVTAFRSNLSLVWTRYYILAGATWNIGTALPTGPPPGGSGGGGGSVFSVFGRSGAVVSQAGDYTIAQITNLQSTLDSKVSLVPGANQTIIGSWQLINAGGFVGPLTGNASTATALATTPTLCPVGQAPTGITASGNAVGCAVFGSAGSVILAPVGNQTITGGFLLTNTGGFVGPLTGAVTGNASTATALAADPLDCSPPNFATGINASGVAQCTQVDFSNITGTVPSHTHIATDIISGVFLPARLGTGTPSITTYLRGDNSWGGVALAATATALAANGTNCAVNLYPLGVDASGNSEGCVQPSFATLAAGTATKAQLPGTTVYTDQTNSFGAFTQNFAGSIITTTRTVTGVVVLSSSGTMTFDAALANHFVINLAGNVTTTSVSNLLSGQRIIFQICQPAVGTGPFTFAWPGLIKAHMTIGDAPSTCSVQEFVASGSTMYATGIGTVNQ